MSISLERAKGYKVKLCHLPPSVKDFASDAKVAICTAVAYGNLDTRVERVDWTWNFLKEFVSMKPKWTSALKQAARDEKLKKDLMTYVSGRYISSPQYVSLTALVD